MTLPVLSSSFKSSLFVLLFTATFLVWHVCHAQQQKLDPLYRMNTIAGGGFDDDVDARQVSIGPSKVYYKRNTGIIYISDRTNNRIRKVENNKVTTIAGNGLIGFGGDGDLATRALINNPGKVSISSSNEIYFADTNNHRIRKIFANGTITTVAGYGQLSFDLAETSPVPAFEAKINFPRAVLLSSDEKSLYITDTATHMIKSLSFESGLVSIVAGSLYRDSANLTSISSPVGLALKPSTNELHFVDDIGVKKINAYGMLEIVAGGNDKFGGDGGPATLAGVSATDIEFLGDTLYIADTNNYRIRVVGTNGDIQTIGGNGVMGPSTDGAAALETPMTVGGISVNDDGEIYFADYAKLSVLTINNNVRLVAGNGQLRYLGNNKPATQSQLFQPRGVAVSPSGEVFISDSSEDTIRKIGLDGVIATFAGGSYPANGIIEDNVPALNSFLNDPIALEFSASSGELYVSDSRNYRVRKIKDNLISTVAGSKSDNRPHGIAVSGGIVYVADPNSNKVFRISQDGTYSVIAGTGAAGYNGDNILAVNAQLFNVSGVSVLSNGDVVIADTNNHRIRKVNSDGIIQTIAGTGVAGSLGDNALAVNAQLNTPTDVEVSPISGEIFIVDSKNHKIRKINSEGKIVTIAGTGVAAWSGDGQISTFSTMHIPTTISISPTTGQIFVTDFENRRIRRLDPFFIESYNYNITNSGELKTEPVKELKELDGKVVTFNKVDTIAVTFPSDFNTQLNKTIPNAPSDLTLVSSVYQVDKTNDNPSKIELAISSPIVTVSILKSDGSSFKVSELQSTINIDFKDVVITNSNPNEPFNYTCMYFDTQFNEWRQDGLSSILVASKRDDSNTLTFTMTCQTTHLTSFSVIDLNLLKEKPKSNPGLSNDAIIAIAVSIAGTAVVIGVISAIVITVCCVLNLKKKNKGSQI